MNYIAEAIRLTEKAQAVMDTDTGAYGKANRVTRRNESMRLTAIAQVYATLALTVQLRRGH